MNLNCDLQTKPGANGLNSFPGGQAAPDVPQQPRITPRGLEILHILNEVFDNDAFDGSGLEPAAERITKGTGKD